MKNDVIKCLFLFSLNFEFYFLPFFFLFVLWQQKIGNNSKKKQQHFFSFSKMSERNQLMKVEEEGKGSGDKRKVEGEKEEEEDFWEDEEWVLKASNEAEELGVLMEMLILTKEGDFNQRLSDRKPFVYQNLSSSFPCPEKINEPVEPVHIFVDFSNIYLGAQVSRKGGERIRDPSIRVHCQRLAKVVEGNRKVSNRVVFGSAPPDSANSVLWDAWRQAQYKVYVSKRPPKCGEQFVDSALIAQIQHDLFSFSPQLDPMNKEKNFDSDPEKRTLILLTGDGNDNEGRASFYGAVCHALERVKWKVEVWAWRASTNRAYRTLAKEHASTGKFKLFYLDDYRDQITFKKRQQHHSPQRNSPPKKHHHHSPQHNSPPKKQHHHHHHSPQQNSPPKKQHHSPQHNSPPKKQIHTSSQSQNSTTFKKHPQPSSSSKKQPSKQSSNRKRNKEREDQLLEKNLDELGYMKTSLPEQTLASSDQINIY